MFIRLCWLASHLPKAALCTLALLGAYCTSAQRPAPRIGPVGKMTSQAIALGQGHVLLLADSADAARWIVQDRYDHFFERVSAAEMSIQMRQPLRKGQERDSLLPAFKAFLQRDMASFSEQEASFVHAAMKQVYQQCAALNATIFPDTMVLIKTHGQHYGDGVYYTRNHCIIVPADALATGNPEGFTSTMFHETFHVYSRLHPEKRRQLYGLIGFSDVGYDQLEMPDELRARLLHNPDGVNFAQRIALETPQGKIYAVPIIYANHLGAEADKPEFMSYLDFSLFEVKPIAGTDRWRVVTKANGYAPTLNLRQLPDFFRQIRDNTGYIIHPDEVLADNFSFLLRARTKPSVTERFSPEGKELLRWVEKILVE